MSEKIEKIVYNIISDGLNFDLESINRDSDLHKDLKADSLDVVELIMEFEDQFEITIPDNDVEQFYTVGKYIDYIAENCHQSYH